LSRPELPGAALDYLPDWLTSREADALLQALPNAIPWQQHRVRLFGREYPAPRLSCWIGDPGAHYTYSRTRYAPQPWPTVLVPIRDALAQRCGVACNSVLANAYRDGRDAMGWHADDEPELGPEPVIASLSLGGVRRFVLRGRGEYRGQRLALDLAHGSLLLMRGATQRNCQHALSRTARPVAPRFNLTFRQILVGAPRNAATDIP